MKRILACFVILGLFFALPAQEDSGKKFKVVLDAGHGGHDPGTHGKIAKEKDIALALTLKLGEYIQQHMPDVEVIYTRDKDVFVELHKRAQIANENHADLFISIHCNGVRNSKPSGTETWVMGLHKSDANLEVAKKENAVILLEDDYSQQYDGFDPNSPEAYIIFSFFQNAYLNQSLEMARMVQNQFRDRAKRIDRGVKQAGFLVLYRATMPSVLVEAGFLTNPEEEKYLTSEEGQSYIASAIYRAFREYRNFLQRKEEMDLLTTVNNDHNKTDGGKTDSGTENISESQNNGIEFAVQIRSSSISLEKDDPFFDGLRNIREYKHAGSYKYYIGGSKTYEEALQLQQSLRARGFSDSFVIALRDGRRIAVTEARREIGE